MAAAAITPRESETASSPLRFPGVSFIRNSSARELESWPCTENLTTAAYFRTVLLSAFLCCCREKYMGDKDGVLKLCSARLQAGTCSNTECPPEGGRYRDQVYFAAGGRKRNKCSTPPGFILRVARLEQDDPTL